MKLRLPRNRTWRYALLLGTAIILFFSILALLRWNTYRQSAAKLQAIVEQLDRDDPGWEWESILKNRPEIPDEENSFAIIAKAMAQPNFRRYDHDPEAGQWWMLPEKLPFEVADWAGQFAHDRKEAIMVARQLADFPRGRHPVKYTEDLISTLLPTVQESRAIANLLQWDIRVNAQLGHFDLCAKDLRAMRNAARSLQDEGFLISMLVRVAIDGVLAKCVEETLSQGELREEDLAVLQKEILEENREPILAASMRTERASGFKMMKYYGANIGLGNLQSLQALTNTGGPGPGGNSPLERAMSMSMALRYPPSAQADQANMLRKMTGFVEALKLPFAEREARLKQIEDELKAEKAEGFQAKNLLTNLLLPAVVKVAGAEVRWHAFMRATATGLAAERHRLGNGRWPKTLDELVPKYMERVEEDPYTGKPLILKALEDGIVVYSVGPNLIDDGGEVLGETVRDGKERGNYETKPQTDWGIRLWNPEKRGK